MKLSDIEGMPPATVAVLEDAGYQTLNDIIDLEREDFLKLAGIAPEEADRLMALIDEVTADGRQQHAKHRTGRRRRIGAVMRDVKAHACGERKCFGWPGSACAAAARWSVWTKCGKRRSE